MMNERADKMAKSRYYVGAPSGPRHGRRGRPRGAGGRGGAIPTCAARGVGAVAGGAGLGTAGRARALEAVDIAAEASRMQNPGRAVASEPMVFGKRLMGPACHSRASPLRRSVSSIDIDTDHWVLVEILVLGTRFEKLLVSCMAVHVMQASSLVPN